MATGSVPAPRRARVQRQALAELLTELGPGHPTLCAGWTNHDLAAHLVTREHVPWAAPGLLIGGLHGLTERAERATMRARTYPELVETFRAGPPWWQPTRIGLFDDATNFVEFFVHTEDVRRAAPGWKPRELDETGRGAMWAALRLIGFAGFRRAGVGVVVERVDRPGRRVLRSGEPGVEIVGMPEELVLYAFGRTAVAQVELRGAEAEVERLQANPVGL
ncbi:TIGR03085 family metal-binding protein [Frankia sp. AgKG'84/4]|uniref:TIGR03085 family metal-binding protein n=1 Tax=Frankia sp. AgKG'84/4 TaxID=573490 RepID=UPI00200CC25F|nr:TIGR03085 family metal-binding protein [Frankia sp. AgKG'84/4]MCL9795274.1 TIGR03085 family metal-binding protein [Frankia sp. AgKG'84/4]